MQITLIKDIENFCMSKGDTLEFKEGGFRRVGQEKQDFYPNFGPYVQLNEVAEIMCSGNANELMVENFTAKEIAE